MPEAQPTQEDALVVEYLPEAQLAQAVDPADE